MGELLYFVDALSKKEIRKTVPVIEAALRHFTPEKWAIVGSLATHYWLVNNERDTLPRRTTELDIVTATQDTIPPCSQSDFVFGHFHKDEEQEGHFAAFVSKKTGLLVQAFAPRVKTDRMPAYVDVPLRPGSDITVPVIAPEEQLVASLDEITTRVKTDAAFGPHDKFFNAVEALNGVLNKNEVELAWDWLRPESEPLDVYATIDVAKRQAEIQGPHISLGKQILKLLTTSCTDCDRTNKDFRLLSSWKVAGMRLRHAF